MTRFLHPVWPGALPELGDPHTAVDPETGQLVSWICVQRIPTILRRSGRWDWWVTFLAALGILV